MRFKKKSRVTDLGNSHPTFHKQLQIQKRTQLLNVQNCFLLFFRSTLTQQHPDSMLSAMFSNDPGTCILHIQNLTFSHLDF